MIPGIDLLGLAAKALNIDAMCQAWPQGYAVGCFDGEETFGEVLPNLRKLLKTGKVPACRVHAHWSDQHKIIPIDTLKKRLGKYNALTLEFPDIKFYVSHSCEYLANSLAEVKARVVLVKQMCPKARVVQSPLKDAPTLPNEIIEKHGPYAKCGPFGIASYDGGTDGKGEGLYDIDARQWARNNEHAQIVFAWGPRCNGREGKVFVPRPERTAYPSADYLRGLARLLKPIIPAPPVSFDVIPFKRPLLWKTFAEDLEGDNFRDNRPVVFLPEQTKFVELITYKAQKIGSLAYFGKFESLHRYYSGVDGGIGLYAYQIAKKALDISGHEWFYIRQGKKIYGPVNAFRRGYFQTEI